MTEYPPCDVLLDILHRLPVKSLIRFRYVSKSWNSLITSPAFINSSLTRSHSNSNKLIIKYSDVNMGHLLVQYELSGSWELCSYDLESQRVKNLGYYRSPGYSSADNYVENLFLLDKPNDAFSKRKVSKKRKKRKCK